MSDPAKSLAEAVASIEAVLFVSGRPVGRDVLASVTGLSEGDLKTALSALADRCASDDSGLLLREVAGGLQLATKPATSEVVEAFRGEARPTPPSAAALEVLSCVLYLGPVSRGGISRVRGVNSDAVVRGLIERGLVSERGRESDSPGAPMLLDVSEDFFIASGVASRDGFPPLEDLVSEEELDRVRERVASGTETSEASGL